MSKRVRISLQDEKEEEIIKSNSIYIPNGKINYGAYGRSSNECNTENDKESDSNIEPTITLQNDEHIGYEDNEYYMYENDLNFENINLSNLNLENDEDNDFYEEPTFNDVVFNDSSLFEKGLLISKETNDNNIEDEVKLPLFEGSLFSLQQFCRYMLIVKTNQNMGDVTFTIIVGSILAFLPERNGLRKYIDIDPSMYDINKAIHKLSNITDVCRVFKFIVCDKGECISSKKDCFVNEMPCIHPKLLNQSFHYFPVRDRIWKLLHSDARNLLHSQDFMVRPDNADEVFILS